jgi:hypothetical protein
VRRRAVRAVWRALAAHGGVRRVAGPGGCAAPRRSSSGRRGWRCHCRVGRCVHACVRASVRLPAGIPVAAAGRQRVSLRRDENTTIAARRWCLRTHGSRRGDLLKRLLRLRRDVASHYNTAAANGKANGSWCRRANEVMALSPPSSSLSSSGWLPDATRDEASEELAGANRALHVRKVGKCARRHLPISHHVCWR